MKTITVHGVVDRPGHGFRRLVWRQLPIPFLQTGFELCPVFDDEAVNGRVDDGQLRQALHVAADIGQGLARQAVHEVQGQVVDAGIVSRLDGPFPLGRRVDPAQEGQHGVGKGLDAQTQAVDAAIGQGCRLVIAQAVRIGFHGNFCIVSDAEGPPQRLQDAADFAGRQQGRRAAADVYRIGFFPGIRRRGDVPAQCLDVASQ